MGIFAVSSSTLIDFHTLLSVLLCSMGVCFLLILACGAGFAFIIVYPTYHYHRQHIQQSLQHSPSSSSPFVSKKRGWSNDNIAFLLLCLLMVSVLHWKKKWNESSKTQASKHKEEEDNITNIWKSRHSHVVVFLGEPIGVCTDGSRIPISDRFGHVFHGLL